MDDQALDKLLSEGLAPLRQLDDSPSQVRSIMDALDDNVAPEVHTRRSYDWLLLAAWLLAALIALPLLAPLDPGALVDAMASFSMAQTTLISMAAALMACLLVYPLLTE